MPYISDEKLHTIERVIAGAPEASRTCKQGIIWMLRRFAVNGTPVLLLLNGEYEQFGRMLSYAAHDMNSCGTGRTEIWKVFQALGIKCQLFGSCSSFETKALGRMGYGIWLGWPLHEKERDLQYRVVPDMEEIRAIRLPGVSCRPIVTKRISQREGEVTYA